MAKDAVKFEVALDNLQKIVREMESGDLPLDNLLKRYEEGMKLIKICRDKLAEAEQKIEILTQTSPLAEVTSQGLPPDAF
jgi:exodeoxyribonuclease VII small subunit